MNSKPTNLFTTSSLFMALIIVLLFSMSLQAKSLTVKDNGRLVVENGKLVNKDKKIVSLAGPSLFWSNNGWEGEKFYNGQTVAAFANDWNASVIRAAMAAQGDGSYLTDPGENQQKVERVVDAAINNDIYVIIDWHSHHAEQDIEKAVGFFEKMARKYQQYPNIIYEIYNEPLNNTDWNTVIKPYAERVIAAIRAIDKNNLILVGTQSWSQDVDKAAANPLVGFNNIAYTLHFYAGTHKEALRKKAQIALDAGLALFVSEWGSVNADGDGDIDRESTQQWLKFIKDNQLSFCTWSVTNKNEASAILKPSTTSLGPWTDKQLTPNGLYLKDIIKNWDKAL